MKRSCLLGVIMILILITQFTIDTSLVSGTSEQYELFKTLARKTIQDISTERGWGQLIEEDIMGLAVSFSSAKTATIRLENGYDYEVTVEGAAIVVHRNSSLAEGAFKGEDLPPTFRVLEESEFHGMKAKKMVSSVNPELPHPVDEDYHMIWVFIPGLVSEPSLTFGVETDKKSLLMPVSESLYQHAANNGMFQTGAATDVVKASFAYSISGLTVKFDASGSTGDIVEYLWDFGDGRTGTGVSASHNYEKQDTYQVTLTVKDGKGNTNADQKTVDVGGAALTLTASTDKALYITNEKIIISGNVTFESNPAVNANIEVRVYFPNGTVNTGPTTVADVDGNYEVSYEVPKIPFETEPPKPEEFETKLRIEIAATYTTANPKEVKATQSINVKIRRIWLELHGIYPVQIVTNDMDSGYSFPTVEGKRYLSPGRMAAVRVLVSCPSLRGADLTALGWSLPKAEINFSTGFPKPEKREIFVGPKPEPIDFFFTVPPADLRVYVHLIDKYNDRIVEREMDFNFKEMKSLGIGFLPLYLNMSDEHTRLAFGQFCYSQTEFIKRVYPLAYSDFDMKMDIERTYEPIALLPVVKNMKYYAVLSWLSARAFWEGRKIVGVTPDDQYWWDPDKGGISMYTWGARGIGFYFSDAVLVRIGWHRTTTAHEIGHTLGLNRDKEEYKKYLPDGKKVTGLILYRKGNTWNIYNLTDPTDRTKAFGKNNDVICFMGASDPQTKNSYWVCDETYTDLSKYLMDPPSKKVVYVAGLIHQNGTVQLENWYMSEGEPDPVGEGPYKIECLSSNEDVLYSSGFGEEVEDFLGFGFVIPYPEGTSRIVIKKGDSILKEVQPTKNPPRVTVHYPNGGETIDGTSEIKWSAEDRDGDKLSYSVLYSYDGGESWMALEVDLNETDCTFASSSLPGGEQCLVKVVATDGLNTGYDVSDRFFTISDKAPFVSIISPKDGDVYQVGDEVLLQGIAYDPESAGLTTQWTSSEDGILGSGEGLLIDELSQGEHTIAFTVVDSTSKRAEEKVKIKIGSADQPRDWGDTGRQTLENSLVFSILVTSAIMIGIIALVRRRRSRQKTTIQAAVKPARYCIECGAPIPEGLAFCKCGRRIDWT